MKYKDLAKSLLIEREGTFSKCSTQVNLTKGKDAILRLANMIPDDELHEYGRENNPHITVLYGITPNLTAKRETEEALRECGLSEIKAKIGDCSKFVNENEGFDVLKFEIISDDLHKLNAYLCENLDYTTDYPDYSPHLTIAYVNLGCADKYIEKIGNKMSGYPLTFKTVAFSDTNGEHTEMELGYPQEVNEDLGYGGGFMSGGNQGMGAISGHLGVYNSPNTRQNPNSFRQYKRYNMQNNNTVVSSGYYDTVFDEDIRKIMALLKDLGFKVEWPSNDTEDEFHLSNIKSHDATHTMTDYEGDKMDSDDVMNDASGINLSKEVILKHLKAEFGDELYEKAKESDEKITYDEILMGLKDVMGDMQFPDKDYATLRVLKQLIEEPKYYSSLGKYDVKEDYDRDIYGTKFKPTQISKILKGMQ